MQPDFPEDLVERSLDAGERFAETVLPLIVPAFRFAADQARMVPPGGVQDIQASLQMLPNAFRCALLKLVGGHNAVGAGPKVRRRGSPNNGLWLGLAESDLEARVYKVSKKYPVRPSGNAQERLIRQERYQDLLAQPGLYGDVPPSLDALLMWQSQGFDLTAFYLLIPNGWGEDGRLASLGRRELEAPDDLSDVATFPGAVEDTEVVPTRDTTIFMPKDDAAKFVDGSLLEEDGEESSAGPDRKEEEE